ncbi:transposase family protein [Halanaerobium sp. Z-7514]|uniref:Transposase family protein n=1 Tax=Halanaerobium polyolivorans TaxID=2886943 RepID=A0AAW4X1J9_9FIRM|nr:transposase family protein [Halanaerobium polyolivorans]
MFNADYIYDHVRCPGCGEKTDKVHNRHNHIIQAIPIRDKKAYVKLVKKTL